MATFWFDTCAEGYFWLKLTVGRQFKSLEEYSPLLSAEAPKLNVFSILNFPSFKVSSPLNFEKKHLQNHYILLHLWKEGSEAALKCEQELGRL